MKTTTLHLSLQDFYDLTKPILAFAGSDDMLPVLTCVRLTTKGDHLVAAATDRFRVGVARVAPEVHTAERDGQPVAAVGPIPDSGGAVKWTPPAGVEVLVPQRALKRALATLVLTKPREAYQVLVTLTIQHHPDGDPSSLVVHCDDFRLKDGVRDVRLELDLVGGQFPKIDQIVAKEVGDASERASVVSLNPELFDAFRKAFRTIANARNESLTLKVRGPGKPIVGWVEDRFIGLQMPRRMHGSGAAEQLEITEPKRLHELTAGWVADLA